MSTIGTMTLYLENKLLNHFLRNTAYTSPTGVWLSLYTTLPNEAGRGTEVSGDGYVRQNISGSLTISGNTAVNTTKIEFPEATSTWGTIVGVGIMDAVTSGNMLFYGIMSNQIAIASGENFAINPGTLILELRGGTKGGWGNEVPEQILNHVLKNISFSTPGTNIYLSTGSSLTYDSSYTFLNWGETSGTGYNRQQVTNWLEPTSGSTCNLNDIVFSAPPIGAEWGSITHIVIYNSSSSGSPLMWGKLRSPIYITIGDGLKFLQNDINITIN